MLKTALKVQSEVVSLPLESSDEFQNAGETVEFVLCWSYKSDEFEYTPWKLQ